MTMPLTTQLARQRDAIARFELTSARALGLSESTKQIVLDGMNALLLTGEAIQPLESEIRDLILAKRGRG